MSQFFLRFLPATTIAMIAVKIRNCTGHQTDVLAWAEPADEDSHESGDFVDGSSWENPVGILRFLPWWPIVLGNVV